MYGIALALLVRANLGLDPWTVFSAGIARHVDFSLGQVTVASSAFVLLLWVPLRQRPGLGTVVNALVVGPVLDLGVALLPVARQPLTQAVFLVLAIVVLAVGTGLYVGVGWGPGPRDGLMLGLAERGVPIYLARAVIEGSVLLIGWLLGGPVGIATVVFALFIGPVVGRLLPVLSMPSTPAAGS